MLEQLMRYCKHCALPIGRYRRLCDVCRYRRSIVTGVENCSIRHRHKVIKLVLEEAEPDQKR
jgi:hypothetical protein